MRGEDGAGSRAIGLFTNKGVDAGAILVSRQSAGRSLRFFAKLPKCFIGVETCLSVHYWGRELSRLRDVCCRQAT